MSGAKYEAMRDALQTVLLEEAPGHAAQVKTSWCCIDATTLRPARIWADIAASFSEGGLIGGDHQRL